MGCFKNLGELVRWQELSLFQSSRYPSAMRMAGITRYVVLDVFKQNYFRDIIQNLANRVLRNLQTFHEKIGLVIYALINVLFFESA